MKRRILLIALGATPVALAGCLADDSEGRGDDRRSDDSDDALADSMNAPEGSVAAHFESAPSRPECEVESETVVIEADGTREVETAETIPYPDPPTEFARDEVVDYVEAFEEAFVTHDVLCSRTGAGHVLSVGYSVRESETFDWHDEISVAFLSRAGGASAGTDGEDVWEAELPIEGVVYAVDESGVARVDFEDAHEVDRDDLESRAPNPLEDGELVAVFD